MQYKSWTGMYNLAFYQVAPWCGWTGFISFHKKFSYLLSVGIGFEKLELR